MGLISTLLLLFILCLLAWLQQRALSKQIGELINQSIRQDQSLQKIIHDSLLQQTQALHQFQTTHQTTQYQQENNFLERLQDSLYKGLQETRLASAHALKQTTDDLVARLDQLRKITDQRLQQINQQVEQRLSDGFAKTTETFSAIAERLTLIDAAQKRITELSTDVISLQDLLADKRARGAFGEIQLTHLLRELFPQKHYTLQYTLSNGKRCDCMLLLPEPIGHIAIDAKFPLENFQRLNDPRLSKNEQKSIEQQFAQDIKHHIRSIAEKYILPPETAQGAILFIPAEAVFSEIHAHYPQVVAEAQKKQVWLASPSTMMAILTTASAVLKDAATKQQIHLIQKHLNALAQDFQRFRQRMTNLARHINLAHDDIKTVHTSAEKITAHFEKIENVEIDPNIQTISE